MFPLGKTARTTRTVSDGISGIACGFIDIVGLLLCIKYYTCFFILSNGGGFSDFATNINVRMSLFYDSVYILIR